RRPPAIRPSPDFVRKASSRCTRNTTGKFWIELTSEDEFSVVRFATRIWIFYRSISTILPVASEHLPVLAALLTLHRMLVAQAQHEGMTIITADEQVANHQVPTIW